MNRLLILIAFTFPVAANAASLQCMFGMGRCIKSQGTEIPAKQALEILDYCSDFTRNEAGRNSLHLSYEEINTQSDLGNMPLVKAWFAFNMLNDSPLAFNRKERNYLEIKRSCQQLERDFDASVR